MLVRRARRRLRLLLLLVLAAACPRARAADVSAQLDTAGGAYGVRLAVSLAVADGEAAAVVVPARGDAVLRAAGDFLAALNQSAGIKSPIPEAAAAAAAVPDMALPLDGAGAFSGLLRSCRRRPAALPCIHDGVPHALEVRAANGTVLGATALPLLPRLALAPTNVTQAGATARDSLAVSWRPAVLAHLPDYHPDTYIIHLYMVRDGPQYL